MLSLEEKQFRENTAAASQIVTFLLIIRPKHALNIQITDNLVRLFSKIRKHCKSNNVKFAYFELLVLDFRRVITSEVVTSLEKKLRFEAYGAKALLKCKIKRSNSRDAFGVKLIAFIGLLTVNQTKRTKCYITPLRYFTYLPLQHKTITTYSKGEICETFPITFLGWAGKVSSWVAQQDDNHVLWQHIWWVTFSSTNRPVIEESEPVYVPLLCYDAFWDWMIFELFV